MELTAQATEFFQKLQDQICQEVAASDGQSDFVSDLWERPEQSGSYGGGGDTRVLSNGAIFEQAGVNFSKVQGTLPVSMSKVLTGKDEEQSFFATGVSLVFHPHSPMIPTTHANVRFLQVGDLQWFGGGMDLTPYYVFEDDARHFHQTLQACCNRHNPEYYPRFKEACDAYFYLPHRDEARGVGGIFFDYLGKDDNNAHDEHFEFVKDVGQSITACYLPIVESRRNLSWTDEEKEFQLIRRGRYVEFNLLFDRGTKFGLETNGRTESILMSLPPQVRWEYNKQYPADSREAKLVELLRNPIDWV